MFYKAKLIMRYYIPTKLKKGMWFLFEHKRTFQVYELTHIPLNDETYINVNGFPVEPYIISDNINNSSTIPVLASPKEIGWFDAGDQIDELHDITIKEINNILENNGIMEIEMEDADDDDDSLVTLLYEQKCTIRYQSIYYEEDEEIIDN